MKSYFASQFFRAKHWASGLWTGVGVEAAQPTDKWRCEHAMAWCQFGEPCMAVNTVCDHAMAQQNQFEAVEAK